MDWIAVYAAIVATASIGWQIYQWWHRRRPHVAVNVKFAMFPPDWPGGPVIEAITVEAINRSEHAVRVTSLGIDLQDGSGRSYQQFENHPLATLPGTVESQDSASGYFVLELIESEVSFDRYEPVTAWVSLSTGETIRSKPHTLLSRE